MEDSARGSFTVHNVQREMSHLTEVKKDVFLCRICGATVKWRRSARRHIRELHMQRQKSRSRSPSAASELEINRSLPLSSDGTEIASQSPARFSDTFPDAYSFKTLPCYLKMTKSGLQSCVRLIVLIWCQRRCFPQKSEIMEADYLENALDHSDVDPLTLSNLTKITHAIPDRAAISILKLLQMGLDFSKVRQTDVTRQADLIPEVVEHVRCSKCASQLLPSETCANECALTKPEHIAQFSTADLAEQLEKRLTENFISFWDPANYREGRVIADCTDGSAHKELVEAMYVKYPGSKFVTLTVNMDGVQLHNDSNKSLWPVLIVINEMRKEVRYLLKNIIVFSLWEAEKGLPQKMPALAMLTALSEEIDVINSRGGLRVYVNGVSEVVRVVVSKLAADTPAKSKLLNIVAFNGFYGCGICERPGFTVEKGAGTNHSYAPKNDQIVERRRTKKRMLKQARASPTSDAAKGMYGIPHVVVLHTLCPASGLVIDDMHAVFEGVTKKIILAWICGDGNLACKLTQTQVNQLLSRFCATRPPPHITRLSKHFSISFWKASEFRNWLLLWSLPCCIGIVRPEYLGHWALLVEAIGLLSKQVITVTLDSDIPNARILLLKFCSLFGKLYGENNYGINVHYLEHLADYVDLHGSLPENSLFAFENFNGFLTRHCHGTNSVRKTLLRQALAYQALKKKASDVSEPSAKRFVDRLQRKRIGVPTTGLGWKSYGKARNEAVRIPDGSWADCADHVTRTLSRFELGRLYIWTTEYKRATERCASSFFIVNKKDLCEFVVQITKIVHCRACKKLLLVATVFLAAPLDVNGQIVSYIYAYKRLLGESCFSPDEYSFFPCTKIVSGECTYFSVSRHWENSD